MHLRVKNLLNFELRDPSAPPQVHSESVGMTQGTAYAKRPDTINITFF